MIKEESTRTSYKRLWGWYANNEGHTNRELMYNHCYVLI